MTEHLDLNRLQELATHANDPRLAGGRHRLAMRWDIDPTTGRPTMVWSKVEDCPPVLEQPH
jgi:hypothetical protein